MRIPTLLNGSALVIITFVSTFGLIKSARAAEDLSQVNSCAAQFSYKIPASALHAQFAKRDVEQPAPTIKMPVGAPLDVVAEMMSRPVSSQEASLQDALRGVGIRGMLASQKVVPNHDENYSHEIPVGRIRDQMIAPLCWDYAALNMIEAEQVIRGRLLPDVTLSRTHMHFFHMFEAANRHFESILDLRRQSSHIENATVLAHLTPQISGGGYFQDVMYLIQKYGLVPESSMPATINTLQTDAVMAELQDYLQKKSYELWNLTEKVSGSKTTPYTRMMSQRFEGKGKDGIDLPKLTEKQNEKLEKAKKEMLKGVWKILEASFGRPPSKFKMKVSSPDQTIPASKYVSLAVEVKEFTPQEFAAKYIGFDANDFVTVSNLVNRPTGKLYSTKFSDTPLPLKLLNLSPARMRELVTQMIDRGFPVWFAADMGPGVDNTSGVMHPALKNVKGMFSFSKSEAPKPISNSEDDFLGNIQGNHAMIFVKYDKPVGASSVIKFGVENSWGVDAGSQGIYHMYPEWFDKYVEHIIVPLGLLTAEERAIYTGQAMKLSPRTGYH